MSFHFAIVIINYKTPQMTINCVSSVLPEIASQNACIIIVDNFSDDDSVGIIEKWITSETLDTKVLFIKSQINRGFSGGNNLGISKVRAEYYFLLNSDTIVRPDAFRILLNTFKTDEQIGFVSPRLEDEDGTGQISCFRFHSPISEFINAVKTGIFTQFLSKYNVPIPLKNSLTYPQWTSFACIGIKSEVIQDIGLMDENYFLYYEDTDYCRMASANGWKVANNPDAHVVHLRGGSAELKTKSKRRERLPQYHFDSRRLYFCKHYGKVGFVFTNLLWTLGRLVSKTREMLERRPRSVSQLEWLDIWTNKQISFGTKGRE